MKFSGTGAVEGRLGKPCRVPNHAVYIKMPDVKIRPTAAENHRLPMCRQVQGTWDQTLKYERKRS